MEHAYEKINQGNDKWGGMTKIQKDQDSTKYMPNWHKIGNQVKQNQH